MDYEVSNYNNNSSAREQYGINWREQQLEVSRAFPVLMQKV